MIEEFHDIDDVNRHDQFQNWRTENSTSHFLAMTSRISAIFHGSQCHHLGSTSWKVTEHGKSLTHSRKVVGTTEIELVEWARGAGIKIRPCQHCVRDGFIQALPTTPDPSEETAEAVQEQLEAGIAESKRLESGARRARLALARKQPKIVVVRSTIFIRNPDVVAEVLERAGGRCEICTSPAPFCRSLDGTPYLEVHHRKRLADSGEDTVENAVAVCPNCHRREHFG